MAKTMTPRQIVAANLRELRQERKFSQEKAGQKAAQSLGVTWLEPKTAFSALERSANPDNKRARALTVDELVGLARAFDVSPLRLLLPPDDVTEVRIQQDKPETAITPGQLLDLLLIEGWAEIDQALETSPHRSEVRERQTELLDEYTRKALGDLEEIGEKLDGIALWAGDLRLRFGDAREKVRRWVAEERKQLAAAQAEGEEES